jgi:hypothetical protein
MAYEPVSAPVNEQRYQFANGFMGAIYQQSEAHVF